MKRAMEVKFPGSFLFLMEKVFLLYRINICLSFLLPGQKYLVASKKIISSNSHLASFVIVSIRSRAVLGGNLTR